MFFFFLLCQTASGGQIPTGKHLPHCMWNSPWCHLHQALYRDRSCASPISLEPCKGRTWASPIRLGSYPQTHSPPSEWAPPLKAGSTTSSIRPKDPGITKCLSQTHTQHQDLLLGPLPRCALHRTSPRPGQTLPTDHKTQAPRVLISVACSQVFPHSC